MDDMMLGVAAMGISVAIGQLKSANPNAYQNAKADVNIASRILGDLSRALDDDTVTMEEAFIILKEINDPAAREMIIGFLNSIMSKCQQKK